MHQILNRVFVVCAVIAAFAVAIHAVLRILTAASTYMIMCDISESNVPPVFKRVSLEDSCYPFRWQAKQREHLRQLLATPTTPPSETGALGLARYAEYARHLRPEDPGYEQAMREGMRRDPQNALYHYQLAYHDLNRALEGPPPTKDAAGQPVYHYTVKDRELLDQAMSELAAGLQLPYHSRRYELVTARLEAMPEQRHWEDQLREAIVISPVPFHLYP